jgi:uncharacterized protein (TIGR00255 family)
MLHSMTGFARQIMESDTGSLTCELRAVNHRYLDVQFRLPDELRPKEIELRRQISDALKRGKVECSLHFRRSMAGDNAFAVNEDLIRQIGGRLEEVAAHLPNPGPVDPIDVLRWPGVVLESEVDAEPLFVDASELLATTLDALLKMRLSEGERIVEMLNSRCDEILNIAASVAKRLPEVLEVARKKQTERLEKLDISADPNRLETELALVSQKLDIDEELDRLKSHVTEIRDAIAGEEAVGRRLDFLMQELNREANTLGSKSSDKETSRAAVELKVLIEQMREQIQNVE